MTDRIDPYVADMDQKGGKHYVLHAHITTTATTKTYKLTMLADFSTL